LHESASKLHYTYIACLVKNTKIKALKNTIFLEGVCSADGTVRLARHHPHRTRDLRSGSQDHHPSKNSVQKNHTNKHVDLIEVIHSIIIVASSWLFMLLSMEQYFHAG
jgi:hypothetical protein